MTRIHFRVLVLTAFIFLTAFSRIIPHLPDFSPLGSIGLFGAAYFFKKWQAFLVPIAATWLSDLYINNVIYAQYNPHFVWFYERFYWQYDSYFVITLVAIFTFDKVNRARVFIGTTASSVIFFLISILGWWIVSTSYPQNFGGLVVCYTDGIPFLNGTQLGDLFYSGVLFGSFGISKRQFPALRLANV